MNRSIVIGLLGKKGHGKDTLAEALVEHLGFTRLAFADALKSEVAEIHGVPFELFNNRELKETNLPELEGQSPRKVLQDYGMLRRDEDPDYWVKKVRAQIEATPGRYVLTDVRMPNEYRLVNTHFDGPLLRVVAPALIEDGNGLATSQHVSEVALDDYPVDLEVVNHWGQPDLMLVAGVRAVEEMLELNGVRAA